MYQHRLWRKWRWAIVSLCVLMVSACGGAPSGGSRPATSAVGKIAATIHLDAAAQQSAVGEQGLWFLNAVDGYADEVDPVTNHVMATIKVGFEATHILASPEANALWVAGSDGSVSRFELSTGHLVGAIPVSTQAVAAMTLTASPPALWVASPTDHTVTRIDTATNRVAATIAVGAWPDDIVAAQGAVWVCNLKDDQGVQQIDPQTNQVVTRVTLNYSSFGSTGCAGVRVTDTAIWVMTYNGSADITTLLRVDPHTYATVATIPLGTGDIGFNMAADAIAIWIPNVDTRALIRVDARTNRIAGTLALSQPPSRVTLAASAVWVNNYYQSNGYQAIKRPSDTVWRISPTA
jgi:YVTN family beta-propeller protein